MKDTLKTLSLNIESTDFVITKLQDSLVRTCEFFINNNKQSQISLQAIMRGLITGDTSSEVIRNEIANTHRKLQFAQENISLWGVVLAEINAIEPSAGAQEELVNIDDLIAQYS